MIWASYCASKHGWLPATAKLQPELLGLKLKRKLNMALTSKVQIAEKGVYSASDLPLVWMEKGISVIISYSPIRTFRVGISPGSLICLDFEGKRWSMTPSSCKLKHHIGRHHPCRGAQNIFRWKFFRRNDGCYVYDYRFSVKLSYREA